MIYKMKKKKPSKKIVSVSGEQSLSFSFSGINIDSISYTNNFLFQKKKFSLSGNYSYNGFAYSFSGY